jgi:hypothetical protein
MHRLLSAVIGGLLLIVTPGASYAQGTSTLALSQPVDINGKPLAGALVYTYLVGTVAQPQNTFQDTGLTIMNQWPLVADQNGRIPMFYMANGSTHIRLTDASGNVQYDNPNVLVIGPSGGSGGSGVDPTTLVATGDIKPRYGTGFLSGYVRANGLTMGNATSGATERANADTQALFIYLYGADANLVVSGGRTGNALNDYNSSKTIQLPDWRGRTVTALADMGNSATNVFTQTFASCSAGVTTTLGTICGAQSETLTLAQIPTGITSSGTVTVNTSGGNTFPILSGNNWGGPTQINLGSTSNVPIANNTVTSASSLSGATTLTSNNTSGGAHTIIPPTMLATIYIKL